VSVDSASRARLTDRACILWFNNVLDCGYLPISSPNTFDNKGKKYVVTNIVDKMGRLVWDKYQSEFFLPFFPSFFLSPQLCCL
jgi:hypothetical protein